MTLKRITAALLLVLVGIISCLLIADIASDQQTHAATIQSIDNKVTTVLELTATSTVASAGISAIPGDTATPIADKLADFTEYFLLILCVLYAEKYLLTVIGTAAFKILIPAACLIGIYAIASTSGVARRLAIKIGVFALAMFFTIPVSIGVSDMIYDTYQQSIDATIDAAEEFGAKTVGLTEAGEDQGFIDSFLAGFAATTSSLTDQAADIMNDFVESLAVMIVTSCVIPLLVLLFFIWLIRMVTGLDIPAPAPLRRRDGRTQAPAAETTV